MAHTGAQLSGSGAQLSGSGAQLSGSGAQLSAISAYLHTSYLGAQLSASLFSHTKPSSHLSQTITSNRGYYRSLNLADGGARHFNLNFYRKAVLKLREIMLVDLNWDHSLCL